MTRNLVILNLMNNYGKYGVTKELLDTLIDGGLADGINLYGVYLMLRMTLAMQFGEHEYATTEEIAAAMELSVEEANQLVEQLREDLTAAGEDPDQYIIRTESTRYMM